MKKLHITILTLVISLNLNNYLAYASETSKVIPPHISFQITKQNWDMVNQSLPKNSIFTVIDVETGNSFDVQRRAGSGHADVQPLTRKDTKIMKDIYDGKWSWRRRAILILANDLLIPASMHGMPHGAGALQNGFPGHFCIHFSGSTTHLTGKSDLSHYVMILKAAGKIDDYINKLPPDKLLNVFLVAVKNNDKELVQKMTINSKRSIKKQLKKIDHIEGMQWTLKQDEATTINSLGTEIPVEIKLFLKHIGPVKAKLSFTIVRNSPMSPWKVDAEPLLLEL